MDIATVASSLLASFLGGGLISACLTSYTTATREYKAMKRAKIEQIYVSSTVTRDRLVKQLLIVILYHSNGLSLNEAIHELSPLINEDADANEDANLQMLCNLYGTQDMVSLCDQIEALGGKIILAGHGSIIKKVQPSKEVASSLEELRRQLTDYHNSLKKCIYREGLKLNRMWPAKVWDNIRDCYR